VKRCREIKKDCKTERYSAQQANHLLLFPSKSGISEEIQNEVIGRMLNDDKREVVRNDWLILQLESFIFKQYGAVQRALILQRMRLLAHLLTTVRNILKNNTLSLLKLINSAQFNDTVEAVC